MAKPALALLLLLFLHAPFAQISLIASNATYGGAIYVLATDNGSLVSGREAQVIPPSGKSYSFTLEGGQAKFNATELGEWRFIFASEAASAFVSEQKTAAPPAEPTYKIDAIWFGIAIALTLALAIAFSSFLLYDFLHPAYSARKSFDGKAAAASITALSHNLEAVSILFDGETS